VLTTSPGSTVLAEVDPVEFDVDIEVSGAGSDTGESVVDDPDAAAEPEFGSEEVDDSDVDEFPSLGLAQATP